MLTINRLTKEKYKATKVTTEESSFHPIINKNSIKLAN